MSDPSCSSAINRPTPTITRHVETVVVDGDEIRLRVIGGGEQPTAAQRRERRAVVSRLEQAGVRTQEERPHVPGRGERPRCEPDGDRAADRRADLFPDRSTVEALVKRQAAPRRWRIAARNEPYRCVDRLDRNGIDIAVGQPGLRPGQTVCADVNAMVRTRGEKGQRKCECVDRATIDASRRSPRGPAVAAHQRARPARTGEHNALC